MPNATQPVLEITDVEKRYQALRPFRLQALTIAPGERVAIVGLDAGAAEVLVNLVTGAGVADRGTVRVQGRNNADIANGDEWLDVAGSLRDRQRARGPARRGHARAEPGDAVHAAD